MPRLLQRYATPLITGLFLVSGVALFLGIGQGLFHEMHEILSIALIVPFALHVWKNWRPMTGYLGRAPMTVALALSSVVALGFALPSLGGSPAGGPPQFAFAHAIVSHSPAEVAPLLGYTAEDMVSKLTAAGFAVTGPDEALTAVATASGKSEFELVQALLPTGS